MWVETNGLRLYCAVSGAGAPLLLLHGNGETHAIFDEAAAILAAHYTVYAVDTRGHGQSQPGPLHYADMAEDVAGLIAALGLERPYLCGFSDGGITALLLAASRPGLLRRLAVCGANSCPGGLKRRWRLRFWLEWKKTRSPLLRLMLDEPHITAETLGRINAPTAVLAGSRDLIRRADTRRIAAAIPNSTLRILPGETHGSYVVHSAKLAALLLQLDGKGTEL